MLRCGMTSIVVASDCSVEIKILENECLYSECQSRMTSLIPPVHKFVDHRLKTAQDQAAAFQNASLKKEIVDCLVFPGTLDQRV